MPEKKLINGFPFTQYNPVKFSREKSIEKSAQFLTLMLHRRSVRYFSDRPVSKEVIRNVISVANSAPSGANKQPWFFCAVKDRALKKQIREAAEHEEYKSYHGRMSKQWLKDIEPLQTDWNKPFLEIAPWLIIVFKKSYEPVSEKKKTNYYVAESTGIATGFLIAAIHAAGLMTLTHTPSPMNFLSKLLNRPANEKPYLLLPVGYAAKDCRVPDLKKKPLEEVAVFY